MTGDRSAENESYPPIVRVPMASPSGLKICCLAYGVWRSIYVHVYINTNACTCHVCVNT